MSAVSCATIVCCVRAGRLRRRIPFRAFAGPRAVLGNCGISQNIRRAYGELRSVLRNNAVSEETGWLGNSEHVEVEQKWHLVGKQKTQQAMPCFNGHPTVTNAAANGINVCTACLCSFRSLYIYGAPFCISLNRASCTGSVPEPESDVLEEY